MEQTPKPKVVKIAIWALTAIILLNLTLAISNDTIFIREYVSYLLGNNDGFRFRLDVHFIHYRAMLKLLGGLLPFVIVFLFAKKHNFARILSIVVAFLVSAFCIFSIYFDGFAFFNTLTLIANLFILFLLYHKDTIVWIKSK